MKRKKPKSRTGELIEMSSAVTDAFSQRDISAYSGQAAFFLILSFFPFMMFFFALLDMTPLTADEFAGWAKTLIPESFWGVITQFVDDIYAGSSGGRLSATIITAIFLSAKAFISLQNGMNSMYQAEETRNIIVRELYAMLYSVIFAVMLLFVLAFMVFGNYIYHRFFYWIPLWGSMVQFRTLICIPILFLFFLVLYVALPNKKQKIKKQIPGAAVSAAAWVIFSSLFSVYVDKYTKYATFYGTVTIIALIMVWLYGCMYVVFLGGFINCALEEKYWK
ncbi:MAG: YihY/virulence factor BrkB family protein [Muribaculaceae bacterium]|nr:YihY/virulence factor BrkB family protein [Roseburia sp.]MCM1432229.1 YihY/virulence factor BrkB family protein [Muribaculaceae bacterium]MCM1491994.1 YihY/virulence factor BrkB family protein [Muribaculaceae bacterium]